VNTDFNLSQKLDAVQSSLVGGGWLWQERSFGGLDSCGNLPSHHGLRRMTEGSQLPRA
jgi:hypothetical protein